MFKKILIAMMAVSLAVANIVAAKIVGFTIPYIGFITAPAGFIGIAISFLITDIISEVYGKEEAQQIVNSVLISLLVAFGVVYTAILMPAAPFYKDASAFNSIMSQGVYIVASAIITLLLSQNIDVIVFHYIKKSVPYKFARNIGSTSISQFIDTAVFVSLGFVVLPTVFGGNPMPLNVVYGLIGSQYVVKLLIAVIDTPIFYILTKNVE